ncbi:MAG: DsbE family thiol:disulfide interchange protein [Geminicoccaceae bacterium]
MSSDARPAPGGTARRLIFIVPVLLFVVVGVFLAIGLTRDPGELPSALIDKPVPQFALPPLDGRPGDGLSTADLTDGQPHIVNVFASWCVPCRVEHPLLMRLKAAGYAVDAINYKDKPADALAFLQDMGDPFQRVGSDRDGRAGIEWGVYGVPETYVIDRNGRVVHRHVGPLMPNDLDKTLVPLLESLK